MSKSRIRTLVAPLLFLLLVPVTLQVVASPSASSVPCTTPACFPGPRYKIIDLTTYTNQTLYGAGAIGECVNPRGTCNITTVESRTTTVQVDLGASAKHIAAGVNVSLGVTSSTSVGCNSPKLRKNQAYRAYVRGKFSLYRIVKTYAGHTWTSGVLVAREPKRNSISCRVERL